MIKQIGRMTWVSIALLFAQAQAADNGVLWKIERAGVATSYLLGTVHVEDPRVMKVLEAVKQPLAASQRYIPEMELSMGNMLQANAAMLLQDGKTLPGVIGQARYAHCVERLADYGVPEAMLRSMKPWAVMVYLSMPKPKTGRVLDIVLYEQAVAQKKPIEGLESAQEQIEIFDSLSVEQQIVLLDHALKMYPKLSAQLDVMIGFYERRDLFGLQRYADQLTVQANSKLISKVNLDLIGGRNKRMADRLQTRLPQGGLFIAVGVLHLPGEQGLIQLLRNLGYTVSVVY